MIEEFFEEDVQKALKCIPFKEVNEIRLRVNAPIIVVMRNKKYYLGTLGFSNYENAIFCDSNMIKRFVLSACDNSMYSVNDSIKNGYITLQGGVRVGVCGEVVSDNGQVVTIKNFQSVNIRIPHKVEGCSNFALDYIINGEFLNTLVIAPPGAGKTTFIRDVVWQLSQRNFSYNVLVVDERNELSSCVNGVPEINLGKFADICSNCTKEFAFKNGIRSMRPDIIITDEIDIDKDLNSLLDAINSGVKVMATIHSQNLDQLRNKKGFDAILKQKLFDRYIVLSNKEGPGTLTNIFDGRMQSLYCR